MGFEKLLCPFQPIPSLIDLKIVHHTLLGLDLVMMGWIAKPYYAELANVISIGVHRVANLNLCRPFGLKEFRNFHPHIQCHLAEQ